MKMFLKIFLLTILTLFLSLKLIEFWAVFYAVPPIDIGKIEKSSFEKRCFKDSIGHIDMSEKMLCDSMLKAGFEQFEILHQYYYSPCEELSYRHRSLFKLRYKLKKRKSIQLSQREIRINNIRLIGHVFQNCLPNEILVEFMEYDISCSECNQKSVIRLTREELNKLCGFKIIPFGKNKWKRVPL